jgi:hypothetical protein
MEVKGGTGFEPVPPFCILERNATIFHQMNSQGVGDLPFLGESMKSIVAVLFFAAAAAAQVPTAACLAGDVRFKVTLDNQPQAPAPAAAPGKAKIYFIHDAGSLSTPGFAYPTTKYAIDGIWAGANHTDSWFSVSVDPGEHHLCTRLQSSIVPDRVELAHFTAQPGKVYYYRTRLVISDQVELLELKQIDSDQGKYLISTYPMSKWKTHK